jgi:adenosylcobinamide-phosphate synthase
MSRDRRRFPFSQRALGAALGLMADRVLGEPPVPDRLHPVALFGTTAAGLERWLYADDRLRGAVYTGLNAAIAAGAGAVVGSPAAAAYLATSGRGLHVAALDVAGALDKGDLDLARELLPNLVGRDPAGLSADGVARATVESVAENTTDAIVAPALWTVAAGSAGTFLHRAGDTLDSMVGYRNDRYARFGTAAARLDDVLAWVPARATAALVALVRPSRASDVWRTVRSDAGGHPSPNAGVAEAAFAAALDVQLGGVNHYGGTVESRPLMGDGRPVDAADIAAAVTLSRHVTWALAGLLATAALATRRRPHRSKFGPNPPT